jgi:hypothetical protein
MEGAERLKMTILPGDRVSRRDAATYLGRKPSTLGNWVKARHGPKPVMIGGRAFTASLTSMRSSATAVASRPILPPIRPRNRRSPQAWVIVGAGVPRAEGRAMASTHFSSRIVTGTRAEQLRVRADLRDGRLVVRLDLLEPIAKHIAAKTVAGRAIFVPVEQVSALCDALNCARAEAGAPDPGRDDERPA